MMRSSLKIYSFSVFVFLLDVISVQGALESTFARCCTHGVNWAREDQSCLNFPAPVPGEPKEHQSICLTSASVCCLRFYRQAQCEAGKQAAKTGLECLRSAESGGEYYKDCCDGCKLGLISGNMGMECHFQTFSFGFPWNDAFKGCCLGVSSSPGTSVESTIGTSGSNNQGGYQPSPPAVVSPFPDPTGGHNVPDSENLCLLFPGQLCGHVCVPTQGSYICECRVGFTLSVDKKSCIQDVIQDRCEVNNPCDHICHDTGVSIECTCDVGFQLAGDQRSCTDVNECDLGTHQCSPQQVCYNRMGTYICVNSDGSISSPSSSPWGQHPLGVQPELPHGYPGSSDTDFARQGVCPSGYKYNLETRVCDDVDECSEAYGVCAQGLQCQNTIGSFTCSPITTGTCPNGFAFDVLQQICLDIDECLLGSHSCASNEFCLNTQGGYECQVRDRPTDCPAGFKYNSQDEICEDVNECEEDLHSCLAEEEVCRNVIGAYECDLNCSVGFTFRPHSRACVDINECDENPTICGIGEVCINVIGSYRCQQITSNNIPSHLYPGIDNSETNDVDSLPLPKVTMATPLVEECPQGYGFELESRSCLDIDECTTGLHNCTYGTHSCINTLGSFTCRPKGIGGCRPGFEQNHITGQCQDVDECATGIASCLPGQICVNTDGAFVCEIECMEGFKYDPSDPAICVDINECAEGTPCQIGERCLNTGGSFMCLGGITEPPTPGTTILPPILTTTLPPCSDGFRRIGISACRDIDECVEGSHDCRGADHECFNLPGSYACRRRPCSRGFRRNEDTKQCEDVDECENLPCRPEEECINTPGHFLCRERPSCQSGFRRDSNTLECVDIDECVEQAPCETTDRCINTRGSYRCRSLDCPGGYYRDPISRLCRDVDECETGEHNCQAPTQQCVNSPGTYRCKALPSCPKGFRRDPHNSRCVDVDECKLGTADCLPGEVCVNQYGKYACRGTPSVCTPGHRYNAITRRCQDIDECSEGSPPCSTEERCVNSIGSYSCISKKQPPCDFGYRYDEDTLSCIDVDECKSGSPCNDDEECLNERGGYKCQKKKKKKSAKDKTRNKSNKNKNTNRNKEDKSQCQLGFRYKRKKGCVDINECREGRNLCNEETEVCINLPGAYKCNPKDTVLTLTTSITTTTPSPFDHTDVPPPQCPQGYDYNTNFRSCIDIDECKNGACGRHEICSNSPGSFSCSCHDGYTKGRGTQTECEDINECQLGLHTCTETQRCDNTLGSYTCTRIAGCGTGYTLNHNTGRCEDKDECSDGEADCKANERCVNSIGSYGCVPKINCGRGYEMNDIGTQCIDIDECKENLHSCTSNQECINRPGGYVCQCPPGYRFDHTRSCQDIDECQSYFGSICGSNGICENTPGSYACNCKQGFEKSQDKQTCLDVDECTTLDNGGCEQNCVNIWGSHYCSCQSGFKLSINNRTCDDIDECQAYRGRGRLCIGNCVNTPGTFRCACPDGYRLLPDQKTCKDIDECDDLTRCRGSDEICINTRGSFKCHEIKCPPNYVRDSTLPNRCKRESQCREDDIHCLQQPLTYSYNFLPLASNMTLRPRGEVDIFTMRGPLWSSTKVHFDLELESTDAPLTVKVATRDNFLLKRTDFNQVVLTLVKSLEGPQDVLLNLNMKLYKNGLYGGSAVAKLLIIVSEFDF